MVQVVESKTQLISWWSIFDSTTCTILLYLTERGCRNLKKKSVGGSSPSTRTDKTNKNKYK
jgi:hypothetical protein